LNREGKNHSGLKNLGFGEERLSDRKNLSVYAKSWSTLLFSLEWGPSGPRKNDFSEQRGVREGPSSGKGSQAVFRGGKGRVFIEGKVDRKIGKREKRQKKGKKKKGKYFAGERRKLMFPGPKAGPFLTVSEISIGSGRGICQ